MRALGLSLVILSLCLSMGGVASRTLADPAGVAKASPAEGQAPAQCRVAKPRGSWMSRVEISDRSAEKNFVPLNSQGYNYGEPGVWRPPLATGHTPLPADVPGRSVPAAPAKP
jgi:hypothetical protein